MWVDDLEGHWPNIEDVDDDRLIEIHKKTAEAINDPILLIQQPFTWYWEDQLRRIEGEMRTRGLGPVDLGAGRDFRGAVNREKLPLAKQPAPR